MLPRGGEGGRVILCFDMDYFYAQCEQLRNPALRDVPVVVCVYSARGGDSGAVATANYIARKHGVRSGMPIYRAKRLLGDVKDAVFLPADFDYYDAISQRVMAALRQEADVFEQVSVDEAFLDVSNRALGRLDVGAALAASLKDKIRQELGLACTVGIGPNKLLAKMAATLAKPDGLLMLGPGDVPARLWPLPVDELYGVGKKTALKLRQLGIETIGQLARTDQQRLIEAFGRSLGAYLYRAANGLDEEPLRPEPKLESISRITTLRSNATAAEEVEEDVEWLCKEVHGRVVREGLLFRSVGVIFVLEDLSIRTRSRGLEMATDSYELLLQTARQLCREFFAASGKAVRRLGVKVAGLSVATGQLRLTDFL
jgi:DNA polymerase IV (DinB-like DNA polymerase)